MRTFTTDGQTYEVPLIFPVLGADVQPTFEIKEGQFAGVQFRIENMIMDREDEQLMYYDLWCTDNVTVDQIKPIVDSFILMLLVDQIERLKNEDSPTE